MESQVKLDEERLELLEKFKQHLPEAYAAERGVIDTVFQDGALSVKVKRLMALAIALRVGCTNCILGQTKRALEQGATREEILETISVNVSMSGTTGFAEGLRVLKLLDRVDELHVAAGLRISTPELNNWLREVAGQRTGATAGKRSLRLFYATQAGVHPPRFLIFCNDARQVHFSFQRYLINTLRERFAFDGAPIRIDFRSRREERDK